MPRTIEEQRAHNAEKMREFRAKKKTGGAVPPGIVAEGEPAMPGEGDDSPVVDVKLDTTEAPKLSFVDRMRQKFSAPAAPAASPPLKRARPKKQENLIATMFPTLISTFTATYASELIADPYKPCGPSQDEVSLIVTPLLEALARSVEVTGKVSQTTIDIINSVLALMMFSVRSYVTYVQIKRSGQPGTAAATGRGDTSQREYSAGLAPVGEPSLAGGLRAYQGTAAGTAGHVAHSQPAAQAARHDGRGDSAAQDGDSERRDAEAALVNSMFKRDVEGRIRLGVLPPRV